MKYSELVESGATESVRQYFLVEGEPTAVTLRIPKNLKDAVAESARLQGISFSAYVRSCLIEKLSGGE